METVKHAEILLQSLSRARWQTAFRTYGSSHATLIGTLVDWWVNEEPDRWALEGGPSFAKLPGGVGGGICDAILGEGNSSRGVVEVEGTRLESTLLKLGSFFASKVTDLQDLEFGIFLAYAYLPTGRGHERQYSTTSLDTFASIATQVTLQSPTKSLVLLALDKSYERITIGPRARNEYYMGSPTSVRGLVMRNGAVVAKERTLASSLN